ncbi:hypothetical protein BZG02_07940 [Labilibaculum filiforme]|uniref:Thioredoxin domain-containing protein n=1 Tax=Labilibaculum filiforme TaxID=1940526 RepID=A0A2N3I118_9BACT|nr:TlpA disulfide reductase family protein [Labilibaculum filiforme]PKQ63933.1 hypothetical protein BZG02_07940 [Labilibaculum filiforme]
MKAYYILILASLMALVSCNSNKTSNTKSNKVVIEGTVVGHDEAIGLWGKELNEQIAVDANGHFKLESEEIPSGKYDLTFGGMNSIEIYLKAGAILKLTVDKNKMIALDKNAISVSGENIEESILLHELDQQKALYQYNSWADYKEQNYPKVYGKLPADFIADQESELEKIVAFIDQFAKKHTSIDKEFVKHLKLTKMLDLNSTINLYGRIAPDYFPNTKIEVPENFSNYFADRIPQNDFVLYEKLPEYADYVRDGYYMQMEDALSNHERESLPYYKAKLNFLDTCDFPEVIKTSMYNGLTIGYMRTRDADVRAYLDSVIYVKVKDTESLARYEKFKEGEATYKDGDMAPQFTLQDINGKDVSLSDFKGKMLMMDCWATWCAPCIKGLPKFNKLKEKYAGKNIVFIAISVDENVDAWKKKVLANKDNLFTGIQLNTTQNENTFKKDLMVQGIPRYILIGADGRLIRREAPSPETQELYELIDNNLK